MKKIICIAVIFALYVNFVANAQLKRKGPLDYDPTEAYLKKYIKTNAKKAILHYDDVESHVVYEVSSGKFKEADIEGTIAESVLLPVYGKQYVAVKDYLIKRVEGFGLPLQEIDFQDRRIKATIHLADTVAYKGKRAHLVKLLEKYDSDLFFQINVTRAWSLLVVDMSRSDGESGVEIKALDKPIQKLRVSCKVYFKDRLKDKKISLSNTYYSLCLAPEGVKAEKAEVGILSVAGALLGDPCSDYFFYMHDRAQSDGMRYADSYLIAKFMRYNKELFNGFYTHMEKEGAPAGVIKKAEGDNLTIMISEPKYVEEVKERGLEKFARKIASKLDEAVGGYMLMAKIESDDEMTPWVTETVYQRVIGRVKPRYKVRSTDYEGGAKLSSLAEGYDRNRLVGLPLISIKNVGWQTTENMERGLTTLFKKKKDVSAHTFVNYAEGEVLNRVEERIEIDKKGRKHLL